MCYGFIYYLKNLYFKSLTHLEHLAEPAKCALHQVGLHVQELPGLPVDRGFDLFGRSGNTCAYSCSYSYGERSKY